MVSRAELYDYYGVFHSPTNTLLGLARTIHTYIYGVYTVCIQHFWQGNH